VKPEARTDRARAPDAGFSLIEMLVAISLLALAITLSLGGLRFTSAAWQTSDAATTRTEDIAVTDRMLRTWMSRAVLPVEEEGVTPAMVFEGSGDAVSFFAYQPPYPAAAGLHQIMLKIESVESGHVLTATLTPFDVARENRTGGAAVGPVYTLATLPLDVGFSFYSADDLSAGWRREWRSPTVLPLLVRLGLQNPGQGQSGLWPNLVFHLGPRVSPLCYRQHTRPAIRVTKICEDVGS